MDFKSAFSIPDDVCYLNCAYLAPQMQSVKKVAEQELKRREQPWQIGTRDFFAGGERIRSHYAGILRGDSDGVALVPSASYGVQVAAQNVDLRKDDEVLLLHEQHPSNVYPWQQIAAKKGARVTFISLTGQKEPETEFEQRIAAGAAVCAIPHCHWTDGASLDLKRIALACQRSGCQLILDVTQSLGAVDFDYLALKPSFLVAAGYKWLLGPYGFSFLYASPSKREGTPVEFNWQNRSESEDFRRLVEYRDSYQPGARRYDMGERYNLLSVMAEQSLAQLNEWGIAEIAAHIRTLTDDLATRAEAMGVGLPPKERRMGHMLGLDFSKSGVAGKDIVAALKQQKIFVSARGDFIRVSPHVYNSKNDIDILMTALARVVRI